jgi:TctA family transporter
MIPGIGGSVVDWLAYSQTVRSNPQADPPFGDGNVKGVIGCEGANNSQKATGYIPTVLFGIPAAPFEAVIMSLLLVVGLEMGTPQLLSDTKFFALLGGSYLLSMLIVIGLAYWAIRWVARVFELPLPIWFWLIVILLTWSAVQYTGYWEDYAVLALCIVLGLAMKRFGYNRAAFIVGFVLAERLEKLTVQFVALYDWHALMLRPLSAGLMIVAAVLLTYGIFFNRTRINYT